MGRRRGQRQGWLRPHRGTWLLTYRDYSKAPPRQTVSIAPASGPGKITKKQAQRFAWDHYLAPLDNAVRMPWATLTLAQFWERHYQSHLERKKKYATQSQYKSLWKLWIEPELGATRLFELKPAQVDRAIAAALAAGRGWSTARHIRKVASAIVEHARVLQMFTGENPAQLVEVARGAAVRGKHALTPEQCRQWFALAEDQPVNPKDARSAARPVRTMSLLAVCCSLGVSEQLGLTWRHVNLADEPALVDGEVIEARSVSVREHSYHGRPGTLKHGHRRRDVPLPKLVVDLLAGLREVQSSDDQPIFSGRAGKPIWGDTLLAKIMKPLAKTIGLEWISWHVFRHTCATLAKTLGMLDVDRRVLMGHAEQTMTDRYTHEDWERMRAGIEKIAAEVTAKPKKKPEVEGVPSELAQDARERVA